MSALFSRTILGTAQLGFDYGINNSDGQPSSEEAFKILSCASKNKLRSIDTAQVYGKSHEVIGHFIKETGKQFDIQTKFCFEEKHDELFEQIHAAKEELHSENLKLVSFHRFADYKKLREQDMADLESKMSQHVQGWGVSVYGEEEAELVLEDEKISVVQLPFNLLDNYRIKGNILSKLKKAGKEIHVRSVFLQGLFFIKPSQLPEKLQLLGPYIEKLQNLAKNNNLTMHELTLLYPYSIQEIDGVILGIDTESQLLDNLEILENANLSLFNQLEDINVKDEHRYLLNPANWNS